MKKMSFLFLTLSLILVYSFQEVHSATLMFDPEEKAVKVNSYFSVDVVIGGLGEKEDPSCGAFDMDVAYDSNVLSFAGYILGPYLGDVLDISEGEKELGIVNLAVVSLLLPDDLNPLQPSTFHLATLTFKAVAPGQSDLSFFSVTLGDSYGNSLSDCTLTTGKINVVPEPATFSLLSLGLIALGLRRIKRAV